MNVQALTSQWARRHDVFLDTNVFIPFVIGSISPKLLGLCKRSADFSEEDFHLLIQFVGQFQRITTTAPIITETCNLLDSFNASQGLSIFGRIAQLLRQLKERRVECAQLSSLPAFHRLGLADASLISGARNGHVVLTTEIPLWAEMQRERLLVVNFNHIRSLAWFGTS